ncbi:MAG: metal ABC transporter permease [Syntrophomonadaceae bacterium]|nr:metal ABC transporter permease [Syntrophomonadaceae bacterium]
MLEAIMHYTFMQHALLAALFSSIACGIMGTIIIEKRLVMMSGGIAHTAFGGIGLGYYLGIEPMTGALGFSSLSSLGIAYLKRNSRTNTDVLMGMFWPLGMALGILFISFAPGYPPDMTSYLFGDILTVSGPDLIYMLVLDAIIVVTVAAFFDLITVYLFDEEFGTALGLNMTFMDYLTFLLIGLTVVVIIRVIGIILILALLCVPPAVARMHTNNLKKMMLMSILLGVVFCLLGLWVSYRLQVASGAAIVIIAVLAYFGSVGLERMVAGKTRPAGVRQSTPGNL